MRLTTFSFRRFGLLSRFQLASTLFLLVFLTVVLQNRNSDNALFDSGHGPPMFYTDTMHTVTDVADQETVDDGRPRRLLTITVDDSSMFLPDVSIFIHIYMPAGIQWRYISYRTQDLASLRLDTDVLMVTAFPDQNGPVATWAQSHRQRTGMSTGLMLMCDEAGHHGTRAFNSFDYVMRHYYKDAPGLRALGNLTCGTGPVWAPEPKRRFTVDRNGHPWLGVHWIMLQGLKYNLDANHGPGSYWPSSMRGRTCGWIGSLRADRKEMLETMSAIFPDCYLHVEKDFMGPMNPRVYAELLDDIIFGLSPIGFNAETHRMAEIMDHGAIPAMLAAEYLWAPYQPVPGVIADDWAAVADAMLTLRNGPAINLLRLQERVVKWNEKYRSCVTNDLKIILDHAMQTDATSIR